MVSSQHRCWFRKTWCIVLYLYTPSTVTWPHPVPFLLSFTILVTWPNLSVVTPTVNMLEALKPDYGCQFCRAGCEEVNSIFLHKVIFKICVILLLIERSICLNIVGMIWSFWFAALKHTKPCRFISLKVIMFEIVAYFFTIKDNIYMMKISAVHLCIL